MGQSFSHFLYHHLIGSVGSRQGFCFDSGPSFYCGLADPNSCNPLRQVLALLGETVQTVAYDPLGHYHFPDVTIPIYGNSQRYREAIAEITPTGAEEFQRFEQRMFALYDGLKDVPAIALRSDWQAIFVFVNHWRSMLKLLPQIGAVNSSVGDMMDRYIQDPWVRRLIDLECFLLSGLNAHGTVTPEVAFMIGERDRTAIDYPIGGSGAIVDALVRGLNRWGGELRLGAHVEQILVKSGKAIGVKLRNGEILTAPTVISNATVWDTYTQLLKPEDLPSAYGQEALAIPAVDSFMHLHLGIDGSGLDGFSGHHVVVHHQDKDIAEPGNTCMISIPSVWDPSLAPPGHHTIHAYTLEPYVGGVVKS